MDEMHTAPPARFRIPVLGWGVGLLVALSPVVLLTVMDLYRERSVSPGTVADALAFPVAYGSLIAAYSFFAMRLEITHTGMRLYWVNRTRWEEITSARRRRFLFLPYLHLARRKGMSWWVPLYFIGSEPISAALLRCAPEGHPVREALRSEHRSHAEPLR